MQEGDNISWYQYLVVIIYPGLHPVWPQDHFGPTLTLAPSILQPKAYFGPRNYWASIILQPDAYFGPRLKTQIFKIVIFYHFVPFIHRLRGCLQVKLKPQLSILPPDLAKRWKLCLAKTKNKSHQKTFLKLNYCS